jgi:hypothetical protein
MNVKTAKPAAGADPAAASRRAPARPCGRGEEPQRHQRRRFHPHGQRIGPDQGQPLRGRPDRGTALEGYDPGGRAILRMPLDIIEKTAVNAGTTTDTTWAAPLVQYQNLASEFIEYLRPLSIVGRIEGFRRVPFMVKVPRQTGGASVNWVGEARSSR